MVGGVEMTDHRNPTLDEICDAIGIITFSRWKNEARKEFESSQYLYKGADAQHAYEYEIILRKYYSTKEKKNGLQNN